MVRTCSNRGRCVSRRLAEPLTDDNFRKASSGPRANQYYSLCNRCRNRPANARDSTARPQPRCSVCYSSRQLQYFLDSNGISHFVINNDLITELILGRVSDVCTFCQNQVGQRRPPPPRTPNRQGLTPSSQHAQSRRRIAPPDSPTPSNPPARPVRTRTRPRHFDSSPDMEAERRCERMRHEPMKKRRDFIDGNGRMHAVCNECREAIAARRIQNHNLDGDHTSSEGSNSRSGGGQLPDMTSTFQSMQGQFRLRRTQRRVERTQDVDEPEGPEHLERPPQPQLRIPSG